MGTHATRPAWAWLAVLCAATILGGCATTSTSSDAEGRRTAEAQTGEREVESNATEESETEAASSSESVAETEPPPGEPAFVHDPTGLRFPSSLGGLQFRGTQQYEQQGLGMSLQYQNETEDGMVWADIYLYDLGLSELGTGSVNRRLEAELGEAIRNIRPVEERGDYAGVKLRRSGEIQWSGSSERTFPALFAELTFDIVSENEDKTPVTSWIVLSTYADHFLKVRLSRHDSVANGRQQAEAYLDALQGELFPLTEAASR